MSIQGINSGLDIPAIVNALVNADGAPKSAQLDRVENRAVTSISALGKLQGATSTFQSALDDLNDPELFNRRAASSGDKSLFTLSADSSAGAGSYDIAVERLAESHKIATQAFADTTTAIGTGTLTLGQGADSFDITLTAENNTLEGLRDAINNAEDNPGISATIVTDDDGARLVLSSGETGTDNQLSITVKDDDGNEQGSAVDPNAGIFDLIYNPDPVTGNGSKELNAAQNALLKIDGLSVTRQSNTISDAIEGVTFTLKAAQSAEDIAAGKTVGANISVDKGAARSKIDEFVKAYNSLIDVTKELTAVVGVGGDDKAPVAGPLVGDSSVRNLVSQLRSQLVKPAGDEGDAFRFLADLGITTTKEGKLEVDSSALDTALDEDIAGVAGFLAGENGLMGRLSETVDPYLGPDGLFQTRVDNLNERLSDVDNDREALNLRLVKLEQRLNNQFNTMDQLVGQFNGTLEYITGALKNLPGVVRQSNDK
ncbi:flagellar filament capping protein FliD [Aestuariirhabdus litorea]|uniref:Flagellar hook-associated protein 2 n=1 Tax=Aestuariirhabdus litorea TaxID=2528527 RepID=A0A3P3VQD9_9GAMM|nr:flagellar filament capping protein FliD [Aestuariirhabdus litorea]RRJ85001.1 flagellar hook protein FliD [Aestuariirhabdus litorea]RWW98226.1 flagellar hook protein FliD [Endozoicomonadaceae bacterium GTF-13]